MNVEKAIESAGRLSRESVELAGWVSLAARVEPALLRRARLSFMSAAGVEVESDLWFGPLVQTRGTYAATFYPEVIEELRRRLVADADVGKRQSAWALVRQVHGHKRPKKGKLLSNLTQLEEELIWHALTSSGEELEREIDTRLRPVIKSIVSEQHDGLGRWALGVLPRLPPAAHTRTVRFLRILSEARLYEGWYSLDPADGEHLSSDEKNMLLKALGRRPAGLRLQGDRLELSAPPREGSQLIEVPLTNPLSLDVSWSTESGEHAETVEWVGGEANIYLNGVGMPLSVTTKTGESYRVVGQQEPVLLYEEHVRGGLVGVASRDAVFAGSGVLVGERLILTTEDVLAAARPDYPKQRRQELLIHFPLLDRRFIVARQASRPLGAAMFDDGLVALNFDDPPDNTISLTNLAPADFASAADSVGERCVAFAFPWGEEKKAPSSWVGFEVQEALEDGTYGLRLTTQVGDAVLRDWSGAPLIDAKTDALIGLLRLRPDPEGEERLLPYLIPESLIRRFLSASAPRSTRWVLPVFVSSTWLDLQPERAAVASALQRLRETKYGGLEYLGIPDAALRRATLDDMDRSLVYVGIIAGNYDSGITEVEYERARERGLPCFVYLKEDEAIPVESRETGLRQSWKLDAFKEVLLTNHIVSRFTTPDELAAKVTADLHRWLFDEYLTPALQGALMGDTPRGEAQALLDATRDLRDFDPNLLDSLRRVGFNVAATVSGGDAGASDSQTFPGSAGAFNFLFPDSPLLHQLRAPVGDFVGREKEVADLLATLRGGASAAISGISGMGGIGKTELAFYVANELRDEYPDAQLVIDMRGTDDPPRDPADALAACVRAFLGPERRVPDDIEELTRIYSTALKGKRALILLDNASHSAQVRPLLPPAGSALLVTSRETITLPGLKRVTLEQLSPTEARELLRAIAPRVAADTADRICYLCGYLPLAIRAAGSLLDVTADLNPETYAEQLQDERRRLELIGAEGVDLGVEASLVLSYTRLAPDAARVFRHLSVFPGAFSAQAEEEMCDDPEHKHLNDLLRRNLVRYNVETQRYSLHDLVRLFAAMRANESEASAGHLRHAKHYLGLLAEAERLYLRGGSALHSGLNLFDLERPNIIAGQRWAASRVGHEEAAELCIEYPQAAVYLLDLRLAPRERIVWLEAGLTASQQLKRRDAEGAHLANLGVAYLALGEIQRAVELLEQTLIIFREIGDRRGEGYALGYLGQAYDQMGETRRAVELYEQQLVIAREIGDRRGEGNSLGNLGLASANLGETRRAVEFYEQQLAIAREIGDRRGEGSSLDNLGIIYTDLGETRRAVEFHEQALVIAREIGDRRGEGNSLFNISLTLDALGNRAKAIAHAEAALEIYEQIESPYAEKARAKLAQWRGQ